MKMYFEWDEKKNTKNIIKHGVSFYTAQYTFTDRQRIILEDIKHSHSEKRFYCIGRVGDEIITVRFTYRGNRIRIIGAGHWRKGKKIYEENN